MDVTNAPVTNTPPGTGEFVQSTTMVAPRDRVRWGPIWAGLMTALTTFLLLELLAYGIGLVGINTAGGGQTNAWVSAIIGLIAFFLGGWVAEASSSARGTGAGLLNGFLVWALGTTLILAFSVFGLSSLFGAVGNAVGQFLASGGNINVPNVGNVNTTQIANTTQAAALGGFISLLLAAIASALGGWLGSRGSPIGRLSGRA